MQNGTQIAVDESTKHAAAARGVLAGYYSSSGNEHAAHLLDHGWAVIRNAIPPELVERCIQEVDKALTECNLPGRFGTAMGRTLRAADLPETFWTIDVLFMHLSNWAIALRHELRKAIAPLFGLDAESLAASFDGVMLKNGDYERKGVKPLTAEDISKGLIPCGTIDDKQTGPTHIDQNRFRDGTANSNQVFVPLVVGHYSTMLLAPSDGWTLQGMHDVLRRDFPSDFGVAVEPSDVSKKRTRDNNRDINDEGYFFKAEHRDHLIALGAVKLIKPQLNKGDALIWSSAIPHCGGTCKTEPGAYKSPRLGLVVGFAPKALLSDHAKSIRKSVVGKGLATGQQILHPSAHGRQKPHCARYSSAPLPLWWQRVMEQRKDLAQRPLWQDREDDTEEQRNMRAQLRSLLE